VASPTEAGPYTFGTLPDGWEIHGIMPSAVTIAPTRPAEQDPYDLLGEVVVTYDRHRPTGALISAYGRDFFTRGDSDHTTILVRTRAGEPEGAIYVQYPDSSGWTEDTMIEFLEALRLKESGQPGRRSPAEPLLSRGCRQLHTPSSPPPGLVRRRLPFLSLNSIGVPSSRSTSVPAVVVTKLRGWQSSVVPCLWPPPFSCS
jgi:hypothetical protein